jgi:hypothetical protein
MFGQDSIGDETNTTCYIAVQPSDLQPTDNQTEKVILGGPFFSEFYGVFKN